MNCYAFYDKYLKFVALDRPDAAWSSWKVLKYYLRRTLIFVCIGYAVIFSSLDIYFREKIIMTEIAFHACDISLYSNCMFRIAYTIYHNDNIHNLMDKMNALKAKADWNFGPQELSMRKGISNSEKVMKAWLFYAVTCIGMVHVFALIEIYLPNSTRTHVTPIFCYYNCTKHPYYEVTLLYEMVTQQMHAFNYVNIDTFFFGTAILLSKQFDILSCDIENIMYSVLYDIGVPLAKVHDFKDNVQNPAITKYTGLAAHDVLRQLNSARYTAALKTRSAKYIRHHQDLLDCLVRLQDIISIASFVQCISSTAYIMFALFALVVYDDRAMKINAVVYFYGCFVQITGNCLIGQMISNKYDKLRQAVTKVPWYLTNDKNFRLSIVLLQLKLNKPYTMEAGKFFELSHQMLIKICQSAFTYFTVLREVTAIK